MATVTVGEIYRLTVTCEAGVQAGLNVKLIRVNAIGGAPPSEQELADAISDALAILYGPALAQTAFYNGVKIQKIDPAPMRNAIESSQLQIPGTGGAQLLPKQVAIICSLYTDTPKQGGRGRMFIPFGSEDNNNADGHPEAAYRILVNAIGSWFTNDQVLTIAAGRTCTIRAGLMKPPRGPLTLWLPFTLRLTASRWSQQKSRSDYSRQNF